MTLEQSDDGGQELTALAGALAAWDLPIWETGQVGEYAGEFNPTVASTTGLLVRAWAQP